MVSTSRSSPTSMMSGSSRRAARRAWAKFIESWPISRWLITHFLSWCTNSIGSSMVTMWSFRLRFMKSIMEARLVDLPEPVMPVTRIIPRRSIESRSSTLGRCSSWKAGMRSGTCRKTPRTSPMARKRLQRKRPIPGSM